MAIKNKIHYQITGSVQADFGQTVVNPIIKIAVNADQAAVNGGFLPCEYNIYLSADAYNNGFKPFKAYKDGVRLDNIKYPAANLPFYAFALGFTDTPPTQNALESQKQIIADTFGFNVDDVVMIDETA